jgi:Rrf2 family protein
MLSLAGNKQKKPVFLKDIAHSEEISEKYLSQIIIPLKGKGLVTTFRGAHGGYLLSRPASEITLRDIVEPLEGDLSLVDCVTSPGICDRASECATREVWDELSSLLLNFLETVTLEDLIKKSSKISKSNMSKSDYSI